jgi:hypothetical protein
MKKVLVMAQGPCNEKDDVDGMRIYIRLINKLAITLAD